MHALEAVEELRTLLNDKEDRTWDLDTKLRVLTSAQNRITAYARSIGQNFMVRHEPAFLTAADFSADTPIPDLYRAAFDSLRYQAIDVLWLIRGGKRYYLPRFGESIDGGYGGSLYDLSTGVTYDVNDGGLAPMRYELHGTSIVIYGKVESGDTFAVDHPVTPGSLFLAPAATATGTTVTVLYTAVTNGKMDRWAGAYDDMFLQATDAAGHATTPNPISAYTVDATKGTFTLKSTVAAISAADQVAPALALPAETHRLITLTAAAAAAIHRGSHKLAQGLKSEAAEEQAQIADAMHQRSHSSRRVHTT